MSRLNQKPLAAAVVMLSLWPSATLMANDFSLQDNLIQVDGVGSVNLSSDGTLDTINASISAPVPSNIPDINFTLINNNTQSGQYDLRLGLIIEQQGSNNRLESILGVVRVTVDGSGNVTNITLLDTEALSVIIRRGSVVVTYTNEADIGVIQSAGANVTISASAINTALVNSNAAIADMVNALTLSGHYNYRITMQAVGDDFRVGTTDSGNFTALARMQTVCELDPASTSGQNFILGHSTSFGSAYAVHGILSLGGATSPSSGFSPLTESCEETPPPGPVQPLPVQAVTNANENAAAGLARAQAAIDANNPNAAKEEAREAVDNLRDALVQLNQQREQEGSTNQAQLLALLETFGNLGQTLKAAREMLDAPVSEEVDDMNTDLINLLELLTDKSETLNIADRLSIESSITQTLAANDADISENDDEQTLLQRKNQLELLLKTQTEIGVDISEDQASQQRNINSKLLQGLSSVPNPFTRVLFPPVRNTSSPAFGDKFRNNLVNDGIPGTQALSIPEEPGAIRDEDGLITARAEDGRVFRYQFTAAAFVPEQTMADGLYNAPNGALYSVDGGVVMEIAAAPANLQTLRYSVEEMGFSAALEGPGILNIALDNGDHVSAAFRLEDLADAVGFCTEIGFVPPSGHPGSAEFVFTAECNNGISQTLVPVVLEQALYATLAGSGLSVRNSRDTGYLDVEGVGIFRPDFFVLPLTTEDQSFLDSQSNLEGIALQAGDFDGDGNIDYRLLSARGKQILWGL